MSTEIQIAFGCPHFVIEEPVTLGRDRQLLQTLSAVAGAGSVRILVNDSVYVPPGGLLSQAFLASTQPAPYQIQRCGGLAGPDNNLIKITTGSGAISVRLPEGGRVSLSSIQRTLRLSGANDLVVIGEKNGALSLTEKQDAGPSSFIRVSGGGAEALGFLQKGSRGAQVYPSWSLTARQDINPTTVPTGVVVVPARFPRFNEPLRGNPTLKVTYTAMPERCPRCRARYVENDYRFDPTGEVITIMNEDLLQQACLKAILTVRGSNPFHPGYGSLITTRIGRKIVGASAALVKEDVIGALNQVMQLQRGQRKYQSVRSREMLFSIDSVQVRPSPQDPTIFFVDVRVRNASNRPINLTTVFTVPGTIALSGTNNLPLGLDAAGATSPQIRRFLQGE